MSLRVHCIGKVIEATLHAGQFIAELSCQFALAHLKIRDGFALLRNGDAVYFIRLEQSPINSPLIRNIFSSFAPVLQSPSARTNSPGPAPRG